MKNVVPLDFLIKKIETIPKLKNKILEVGYASYPHKYYVIFKDNEDRKIKFGHQEYQDTLYRIYKSININYINKRRELYRNRHEKEKDQPINTPGFLSYHILW
jgi:hypothetical protein